MNKLEEIMGIRKKKNMSLDIMFFKKQSKQGLWGGSVG